MRAAAWSRSSLQNGNGTCQDWRPRLPLSCSWFWRLPPTALAAATQVQPAGGTALALEQLLGLFRYGRSAACLHWNFPAGLQEEKNLTHCAKGKSNLYLA